VPDRLWNPQAPAANFRQLVYRIEDQGSDAPERWRLALLHTVGARREGSPNLSRFIFFHAAVGEGLAVPDAARTALAPATAGLLSELPSDLAAMADLLADPETPVVGTQQAPYVLLLGTVAEDFPRTDLPSGVIADGTGAARTFRCPPQHVMALAERDDVQDLTLSTPVWLTMTDAMNRINLAGRTFPAGVTAANTGHGVVVGIVDSGIDGGHPAFLGRHDDATKTRIHSVWHMWESGGQSPWQRSSQNEAYRAMHFGREYIGHDEVTTTQDYSSLPDGSHRSGHGTHVAGIAAGRPFGTWPGGVAPAATIVVASTGSRGGYINDVIAGVKYCFQKAAELSMPCVVNISLGTERHSHDGTDPLSNQLDATGVPELRPSDRAAVHRQHDAGICRRPNHLRRRRQPARKESPLAGDDSGRGRDVGSLPALWSWPYVQRAQRRDHLLGPQRGRHDRAAARLGPPFDQRGAGHRRGRAASERRRDPDAAAGRPAGQPPQRPRAPEQPAFQPGGLLDSAGAGDPGGDRAVDRAIPQHGPVAVRESTGSLPFGSTGADSSLTLPRRSRCSGSPTLQPNWRPSSPTR
jgi:hypothetical protein